MARLPFAVAWLCWLLYWGASARNVKPVERVETRASRLSHSFPVAVGAVVAGWPVRPGSLLALRLLPSGLVTYALGLALTVFGLSFSVYARAHLGSNWSASVMRRRGHELVRSGPYRWVRHPIYSGLLVAFVGGIVAGGCLGQLLGAALLIVGLVRKLRIEERWMHEAFGDAYARYRAEVPALVPSWRALQRRSGPSA